MDIYSVARVLVLMLVLLPLAAAAAVPLFGAAARRAALVAALLNLGLAAAVVLLALPAMGVQAEAQSRSRGDATVQRFRPVFVPGDTAARGGGSVGADGRTGWTLFTVAASDAAPDKPGPRVQLYFGIDGLNVWLVALAAVLLPVAVLVSWESIRERPGGYYACLLALHAGLVGAFLSFDAILFYVFFELTLIPAYFLIGNWGTGSARRDAARKFFLYTLAGSLFTLVGIVGVAVTNPTPLHPETKVRVTNAAVARDDLADNRTNETLFALRGPVTFSIPDLMHNVQVWVRADDSMRRELGAAEAALRSAKAGNNPQATLSAERRIETAKELMPEAERIAARAKAAQVWFFLALVAGFLVKVPVWPFHTWLPAAYGAAPVGTVAVLSAVMAKLGTFGILRLVLPLTPDAAAEYGLPVVGTLAAVGIVYGALCAYASTDLKMVLAYSSVSHLGLLVLGLFAANKEGLSGAVLHMVNHGLSTGALFAALAFLVDRYGTTETGRFGGLMGRFPAFALLVFVPALASIGLPGLNNFVSEALLLAGVFAATVPGGGGWALAVTGAAGVFLGAWYTLTALRRVFFQPLKEPAATADAPVLDVNRREFLALGPLAGLCLAVGLFPQLLLDPIAPDARVVANVGGMAKARVTGVPFVSDEPPDRPLALPAGGGPVQPKGGAKGGGFPGGGPKGGGPKGGFPKGGGFPGPKDGKGAPPKAPPPKGAPETDE